VLGASYTLPENTLPEPPLKVPQPFIWLADYSLGASNNLAHCPDDFKADQTLGNCGFADTASGKPHHLPLLPGHIFSINITKKRQGNAQNLIN